MGVDSDAAELAGDPNCADAEQRADLQCLPGRRWHQRDCCQLGENVRSRSGHPPDTPQLEFQQRAIRLVHRDDDPIAFAEELEIQHQFLQLVVADEPRHVASGRAENQIEGAAIGVDERRQLAHPVVDRPLAGHDAMLAPDEIAERPAHALATSLLRSADSQ